MFCEKLNFAMKFMLPKPQIFGTRSKSIKLCCKTLILYVALKVFEKIKEKLTMPGFPRLPLSVTGNVTDTYIGTREPGAGGGQLAPKL